ncbi:MAG: hypothetical protein R2685_10855 [Candidatus Nitrosocosmicus sp.]|nr:hypothetical protein [Candidatus Nitrosocosmicus sp.]
MIVNLGNDTIWEVIDSKNGANKAIQRDKRLINDEDIMTINMSDFDKWYFDNLEDLQRVTESQARIIFQMSKWGQSNYKIDRQTKILFTD